mgnify:CR=1 FL=1
MGMVKIIQYALGETKFVMALVTVTSKEDKKDKHLPLTRATVLLVLATNINVKKMEAQNVSTKGKFVMVDLTAGLLVSFGNFRAAKVQMKLIVHLVLVVNSNVGKVQNV